MNYKLIYNPREFNNQPNKAKISTIYGAREGNVPTGKLIEKPAVYSIAPNELKKFRLDVADYLLRKYGFLEEVQPRDVDKVLERMKEKKFKCPLCDFKTNTEIALKGHMRSHKLSEEAQKILNEIPEAKPEAFVIGAEKSGTGKTELVSPDEAEGMPNTSGGVEAKDRDNVTWYGEGLEQTRRKGTPGQKPTRRKGGQL